MFPGPWSSGNGPSLKGIDESGVQRFEFYHINSLLVTSFSLSPLLNPEDIANPTFAIRTEKRQISANRLIYPPDMT